MLYLWNKLRMHDWIKESFYLIPSTK